MRPQALHLRQKFLGCAMLLAVTLTCEKPGLSHQPASAKKETSMEAPSRVLDLIPTLLEKLPFQASDVSRITGVPLTKDQERSNAAYEIYRAESPNGPLTAVEVRQRQSPKPGKNGLVLLDVSEKACISQQQAQKRFGERLDGLSVPTPHQPSDSPVYLTYKQSWGELRLGFAQTGSRCLVSIVLDATK